MLGWLWRVLVGRFSRCDHKWDVAEVRRVTDRIDGGESRYQRYVLLCQKCGDVQSRDIK